MKKRYLLCLLLLVPCGFLFHKSPNKKPYTNPMVPDVTVAGFVQMADGLGRQSVELISALKDDFDVHFQKTRALCELEDVPKDVVTILENTHRPLGNIVIYEDSLIAPHKSPFRRFLRKVNKNQIHLAYSMYESSQSPSHLARRLEKHFDAIVVPDPHNIESFTRAGLNLPIFLLPLGLELDTFINAPLKSAPHTPFVFGCFASCADNKNQLMIVRAFAKAFGNREDVLLKLNARRGFDSYITAVQEEIKNLNLHNVEFVVQSLDKEHYLECFQSIDCYVSLSKGEGFSIQPREALALGIPVIASDHTAQSTLCHSGLVRSVPAPIEEYAEGHGSNFNVILEDAVAAFTDVFEHYDTYLTLAQQGREWVKQYEFKNLKSLYHTFVKPKKIVLGDENLVTQDVLITNSKPLYKKYLKLYPSLKP